MNNEELIEWVKANLQEVQELKEKTEITKQIREYDKYCYTLVGKVIKARREELQLSKRDLAEILYTNPQNILNYENGKKGNERADALQILHSLEHQTPTKWSGN